MKAMTILLATIAAVSAIHLLGACRAAEPKTYAQVAEDDLCRVRWDPPRTEDGWCVLDRVRIEPKQLVTFESITLRVHGKSGAVSHAFNDQTPTKNAVMVSGARVPVASDNVGTLKIEYKNGHAPLEVELFGPKSSSR